MLLLDTHVWFWAITGSGRLTANHRKLIERRPDECAICSATVWELGMLARHGRIRLDGLPREWLQRAFAAWPVTVLPIDQSVALRATEIRLETGDPVDHLIAACALLHAARLMTRDAAMLDADWLNAV